uniref:Uncharacterized protein n=1 Tax=Sphaerodactylus townsendi TaxID=933632 RepID=A0ACB8F0V7_9SAUR
MHHPGDIYDDRLLPAKGKGLLPRLQVDGSRVPERDGVFTAYSGCGWADLAVCVSDTGSLATASCRMCCAVQPQKMLSFLEIIEMLEGGAPPRQPSGRSRFFYSDENKQHRDGGVLEMDFENFAWRASRWTPPPTCTWPGTAGPGAEQGSSHGAERQL